MEKILPDNRFDPQSAALAAKLLPGERVLWQGKSSRFIILHPDDIILIPFVMMAIIQLIFLGVSLFENGLKGIFFWFSLPTSLPFIYLYFRFSIDWRIRNNTLYAVTNQRVLIDRQGRKPKFTAISLLNLPDLRISGSRQNGTLKFYPAPSFFSLRFKRWFGQALAKEPQFLGITDAAKVRHLILQAADTLARQKD